MEADMSVLQQTAGDALTSLDQVIQAVDTLYNSKDPANQAKANEKLTALQSTDGAWQLCWQLLDLNQPLPVEVRFFAANTLVLKINQTWNQQDDDWLENQLRPKLFDILLTHASSSEGSKLIVERLALALATFALHSIPTFWPNAIEHILTSFRPENLPINIAPQKICTILLKILMYIPEEYSVLMPQLDHKTKLNSQMTLSGPIVFQFLHSLLVADVNTLDSECKRNVLKCTTSWTLHSKTSLLELDDGGSSLNLIYDLISDDELCGQACTALAATFCNRKADSYINTCIRYIPKIAKLRQVLDKFMMEGETECVIKVYSLVINFSENHSKLYLKLVLDEEVEDELKQAVFATIRMILDCTSAPGYYGVDEKYSEISFPFWFSLFESFCYYSDSQSDLICKLFNPLVDSLFQVLIKKSNFPPPSIYYEEWNDDDREAYRCYRQDIGDNFSLIVQFPRAREGLLAKLLDQLQKESNVMQANNSLLGGPWQGFESVVFAIRSISESVPYDETQYMPKIFDILSRVNFNESHVLLYCTIAETLSCYSDWLYNNHSHLATAFNILFLGVNSPHSNIRLMSTISLKDLTSECQAALHPYAPQIVKSCVEAILAPNTRLSTQEKSRLMYTIGTTLAISPVNTVASSLASLSVPIMCDLSSKASSDPTVDSTARAVIIDRLTMLNSLIESLHVKHYSGNEYENDGDENDSPQFNPRRFDTIQEGETSQPALSLLQQLTPILTIISRTFRSDEEVIGLISNTVRRSARSLGIEIKPVLKELLMLVVACYEPLMNSSILEGGVPLYLLFCRDKTLELLLLDSFARISTKTLEACIGNPLQHLSMTIEDYFKYATQVCRKSPSFLQNPTQLNIEYVFKLAVACLELPEKRTLSEVCGFLCLFKTLSLGVDHMKAIIISHLSLLLNNLFNLFGGAYSTPRNAIEPASDLLFSILDIEESREHLKMIIAKDRFPTEFVNSDHKSKFVSTIVHEKNRRKFREACNAFVLMARNLNRSQS